MSKAEGEPVTTVTIAGPDLRRFLEGLPGVDSVGAEARAAVLASRSIKTTAKRLALDLAISMIDLTTLEGQDTPGKVRAMCAKAKHPDPTDPTVPMVAAVCVYPDLAEVAAAEVKGTGIHVASVATGFPSGRASLDVKLADVRSAIAAGADEVDMVIDRGAFLAGKYQLVFDEIAAVHEVCAGKAHLKVVRQIFHDSRLSEARIREVLTFTHCCLSGLSIEGIFESRVKHIDRHLLRIKQAMLGMLKGA